MTTLTIDTNYGYVLLAATSTFLLNSLHSINTGSYRRAAGVEYPAAYAPPSRTDKAAMCFNSAQRAHANYIENQPTVVPAILIAGTRFPLTTAGLGFAWVLSRWLYMTGYSKGLENGKGRYRGISFFAFQFGLIGLSGYTGAALALGW